jgi:hypothetical protein
MRYEAAVYRRGNTAFCCGHAHTGTGACDQSNLAVKAVNGIHRFSLL